MQNFILLIFLFSILAKSSLNLEIIYAINCGGDAFQDSLGIRYRRDYLVDGVASDYGKSLQIKRVSELDQILYQTERYSSETFGYTIPMPSGDGDYVLWLKFAEVWFNAPNQKVFDISLNDIIVIKDLDIFERVGRGVAHDELVAFQIRNNKIIINGKSQAFNNEIRVEFVKTDRDNPKINAILVQKGVPDQIPKLPELEQKFDNFESEDEESEEFSNIRDSFNNEQESQEQRRPTKRSKYEEEEVEQILNPYETDTTSYLIPLVITIALFIPLLLCLCKM